MPKESAVIIHVAGKTTLLLNVYINAALIEHRNTSAEKISAP